MVFVAGRLLPVCLALLLVAVACPSPQAGDGNLDPRLSYLLGAREALGTGEPADLLRNYADPSVENVTHERRALGQVASAACLRAIQRPSLAVSIRFVTPPEEALFTQLRSAGVEFADYGKGPAGSGTVYPAEVRWESLAELAEHPAVACISPAWRINAEPPLANSRPQVQADQVWTILDELDRPVTGEGRLIADFDTGVNYFHPALFFADGDTAQWIDQDSSGDLSEGDAVDLNGNGSADAGETLRYDEAEGAEAYGNSAGRFNPEFDWLYNDANDNGAREYGASFGEAQPGYGELLFVALDSDGDDLLDVGEQLIALGTSKIRAVRGRDGSVAVRGSNLLTAELDYYGHGTQVSGIVCGGWAGINRMSGIAPGAEMIHGINDYASEAPFLVGLEDHLAWAATYQPDAFLIEDGEWVWEYLDGSSNTEIMLNEYASDPGIIAVVPAGNLATGGMHTLFSTLTTGDLHVASSATVCWTTFLWRETNESELAMLVPTGQADYLALDGSTQMIGAYEIYSYLSTSTRGTHRIDIRIEHETPGTSLNGHYSFLFVPEGSTTLAVHGYFYDNHSSWYSASSWAEVVMENTVTWPATADSAVSVAAYIPQGDAGICSYSGWGPRIDGEPDVHITAPGSVVTSLHPFYQGEYVNFGGTSGAGPHVAGAVALMRQLIPEMDSGRFRVWLSLGAGQDGYTDDPDRWGAGKLRIFDALSSVSGADGNDGPAKPDITVAVFPNPSWGGTSIHFGSPAAGSAQIQLLDVQGRVARNWQVRPSQSPGWTAWWDGSDREGIALPAGVYYVRALQGDREITRRLVLLR